MTEQPQVTPTNDPSTSGGLKKESIWEVYYPSRDDHDREAIPVASFPMIIYFWPTMLMFTICGFLSMTSMDPTTIGWFATVALAFNLMVIVTDLDQKKFVITVLLVAIVGLGAYISSIKDIGIVGGITDWFASLEVTYSTANYFIIGVLLWFFFGLGMIQPRFNYWRLEPNEFVHYIQPWGRDQSVPRQGSTVTREVPDILELILTFGGGTLVIKRDNQVVARIQHVPFLGRRMHSIERMLGVTRVRTVES